MHNAAKEAAQVMTSALELSCDTFRCDIAPALGVRVLQAGESMSAVMSLQVERVR